MTAVFLADDRERGERIAEHLTRDFVYISPAAVFDGADGLSDAFSRFRHEDWRHTTLRRTTDVDVHHEQFRYAWERKEGEAIVMQGWSFGSMDHEGKISRIVSFDGLIPGQHP
jgi:hypothetical protein